MLKNFVQAIEMESIDSATFTGNLQALNADGLPEPCVMLRFVNDSDRDITISYDGALEHDYLRSGDNLTLNFQTNSLTGSKAMMMKQGTVVYVSGLAGGTGLIYLTGYYQS